MNFDALLEYQKIDLQIVDFDKQFNAYPVVVSFKKANNELYKASDNLEKLVEKYNECYKEYEKVLSEFNKIELEINDSENQENNYSDAEQMQYPIRLLNDLTKKLEELEANSSKIRAQIKSTAESIENTNKEIEEKKKEIEKFEGVYKKGLQGRANFMKQKEDSKKALESSIDPKLLEHYKSQMEAQKEEKNKKKVVYVHTSGNPMCPACYKHMGNAIDGLKNSGDFIFCPECGAILIIK